MPLYEYHCEKCGRDHEIAQKISAKPLKICPSCGGRLAKKISATAFQLKGSGWYKDGYSSTTTTNTSTTPKKSEGSSPTGPGQTNNKDSKKDTPNKNPK